jgi:hypothetical protein
VYPDTALERGIKDVAKLPQTVAKQIMAAQATTWRRTHPGHPDNLSYPDAAVEPDQSTADRPVKFAWIRTNFIPPVESARFPRLAIPTLHGLPGESEASVMPSSLVAHLGHNWPAALGQTHL